MTNAPIPFNPLSPLDFAELQSFQLHGSINHYPREWLHDILPPLISDFPPVQNLAPPDAAEANTKQATQAVA